VQTPTEVRPRIRRRPLAREAHHACATLVAGLALTLAGCGEPSEREYKNRRELEALLTAVSLKNIKELEKDAKRIDGRHDSGELSDSSHKELKEIVEKARAGDWSSAEKRAYEFREQRPFFK
jgi:hypothetical protein